MRSGRVAWVWRHRARLVPVLVTGVALVAIAVLFNLSDLLEPAHAASSSRGEDVLAYGTLLAAGLAGVALPFVRARWERAEAALGRVPAWLLPTVGAIAWLAGWVHALQARDPAWLASGIDWHDSILEAYALRFDDPAFYCAWRYPLYPALGAALSEHAGLPLDVALQAVSRAVMLSLPVPLWIVGRALFGRAATLAGIGLLVVLPTFQHHVDATTPYPLYIFEVAWVVAGLTIATRGALVGFGVFGVALGCAMATDVKSLALALAVLPIAAVLGVGAPGPGRWKGLAHRVARVLLVVLPLVGSYRWMGSLAATPQTLEEMSSNTLFPPDWPPERYRDETTSGYVWGRWNTWDQVPRTLATFAKYGALPEMKPVRAHRTANTAIKARKDYPGSTVRLLWVAAAGLALALVRGRRAWAERTRTVIVIGTVLAVVTTCIPPLLSDYQDRYMAHALVFVPLLVAGAGDVLLRVVVGTGSRLHSGVRLGVLASAALAAATWPGFPLSAERVASRIGGVSAGGAAEREVQTWADATMQPGDVLLDTSWMMTAALVAGGHTVLREDPVYPPTGVPVEAAWRATRPWAPVTGTVWVLVPHGTEPPPQGNRVWVPARFATDPDFERVTSLRSAMSHIYRYRGEGVPRGWHLPSSLTGTASSAPTRPNDGPLDRPGVRR